MSETSGSLHPSESHGPATPVANYSTPALGGRGSLAYLGGALGVAACLIGFAVLFAACAGFGAALMLSILPEALGVCGLVLTVTGAVRQKGAVLDTHVLAGVFLNVFGIVGGLLEMSAWLGWTILPH